MSELLRDVLAQADGGAIGRPHVARAMIASGWATDSRDAFDRYLGAGKPAYVGKDQLSMPDAIAMIHDAGASAGRLVRMRRRFPDADAVIFGHSHIPLHERGEDGFQIFNPGSPTDRRRSPQHTMGLARVDDGAVAFELIQLA